MATSGDIQRMTYSKNVPKILMVEMRPSSVAAVSTANKATSTRSRRFQAQHIADPTSITKSANPR